VLKKSLNQAQFSPFFKKIMYYWGKSYDLEKLMWPSESRESFYLTTLQAEVRVTNICFDGGAVTLTGDYSVGSGNSCIWIRPDQINVQPGCLPVGTVGSWGRP